MSEAKTQKDFHYSTSTLPGICPLYSPINKKTRSKAAGLQGGDEWNRTIDTRIFSPLLYQLSYITSSFECAKIFKIYIYKKIMRNKLN
jgi:hypothetical protein